MVTPYSAETPDKPKNTLFAKDGKKMSQLSLDRYKKWPQKSAHQQAYDLNVMIFLIKCNLPFAFVEQEGFRGLVNHLQPQANFRGRMTMRDCKLPIAARNVQNAVNSVQEMELQHCGIVAFTSDFWKAKSNDQYFNVSLHYINDSFQLRHFAVGFEGWTCRETGVEIAARLTTMLEGVKGFTKAKHDVYMITDSDAKMKSGIQKASKVIGKHLPCIDHQLQLALKHATESVKLVDTALKMARGLAARLHQSAVSNGLVKKEAKGLGGNMCFLH
jgi:hypothetical protein